MPVPRIAVVGRPNVGKSSLVNMLAKGKVSIVDDTPGTTRDRVSTLVTLESPDASEPDRTVEVTDTGGYGAYVAEGRRFNEVGADLATLTRDIEHQIAQAVASADLVLFVVDAQAGVTPQDRQIAQMLRARVLGQGGGRPGRSPSSRRRGAARASPATPPPILVVANKTDGPRWEAHAAEAAALGFGEPLMVSAKNNYHRRDFVDALYEQVGRLPVAGESARGSERAEAPPVEMKLAIIGKRNAGKSTLVNALAGEDRVIVSEIAGTTRDAVDVRFEMDGRSFLAIDTAGLRRKKSFADRIEWWAFDRMEAAVRRADVVLLLIDATEPVSQVDQQLAMLVARAYKPVVIVVNKWDQAEGRRDEKGRPVTPESYEPYLHKALKGLAFAPIVFISAATGLNVRAVVHVAFDLLEQARRRVTTGRLNRLVRRILEERGPASKLGTFAKLYYVAQIAVEPPTIGLVVNKPELFKAGYERFLLNRFREELPFPEVPIRLVIKGRKRTDGSMPFADVIAAEGAGGAGPDAASYFDET
jgi:GTP-binding protein